jgi:endonuclease/exonuclease/phosphatase (EEP) superfamily protein YafD
MLGLSLKWIRVKSWTLAFILFVFIPTAILVYFPNKDYVDSHKNHSFSVVFSNINSRNNSQEQLIKFVSKTDPDFLLMAEVSPTWKQTLTEVSEKYPFQKILAFKNNFGLAIFSKYELDSYNVYLDKENLIPTLFVKTKINNRLLNLVVLHSFPPLGSYGTLIRDQYLKSMATQIRKLEGPTLVCGDFNTTPWTYAYKDFLRESELQSIRGSKHAGSWPTILPLLRLPLDHCFSKSLKANYYALGSDVGSDHLPIVVRMAF